MANRIRLLRPDDLLCLEIEPVNLRLNDSSCESRTLLKEAPDQPSYLVVHFPPQAILEQAFLENPLPDFKNEDINQDDYSKAKAAELPLASENPDNLARAQLSGPSRLVFRLPDDSDFELPYTVEALLNWDNFELVVTPVAGLPLDPTQTEIDAAGATRPPTPLETAIEYPCRLVISPQDGVQWGHSRQPVTHQGITELWHTRMLSSANGPATELSKNNQAPLRAVWSPDYEFKSQSIGDLLLDKPPEAKPEITDNSPFRASMNEYDRFSIVLNTTAFSHYLNEDGRRYKPQPFWAEQFMLSSLGAWLRSRGNWELPYYLSQPLIFRATPFNPVFHLNPINLINPAIVPDVANDAPFAFLAHKLTNFMEADTVGVSASLAASLNIGRKADLPTTSLSEWVHRATMGRDHYVRIVYEGFLYPFGHRAALVKVTERKIKKLSNGRLYALLQQRFFIVVREPMKDYSALHDLKLYKLGTQLERHMPFKNIRLTTLVTPDIIAPGNAAVSIPQNSKALWVKVNEGGQATSFRFHAVAEDHSGKKLDFNASMIFVFADGVRPVDTSVINPNPPEDTSVYKAYAAADAERRCPFNNQPIAYVKTTDEKISEKTRFETDQIEFHSIQFLEDAGRSYKGYVPFMLSANVKIPALEQILGSPQPTTFQFFEDYLKNGLLNTGKVFAELVRPNGTISGNAIPEFIRKSIEAKFEAKQAGGISTPSFSPSSLSAESGPLGGNVEKASTADFEPADYFPTSLGPKLFGEFDLMTIIDKAGGFGKNAPKIVREVFDLGGGKQEIGATMNWEPKLKPINSIGGVLTLEAPVAKATMTVKVTQVLPPDGRKGITSEFKGKIEQFDLEFFKVIRLNFKLFSFTSINGAKPDMDVQLNDAEPIKFIGALEFVNEIKNIIPKGLFGNGASLDLIPTGVRAGFSFAVPPLAVGVFALQDIVLSAYLTLPFASGKPTFDFAVSERHKPFNLTVAFLGGGGFFHLQVDTKGIRMLEASLEFGANASIDLGVASGGVHFMAGIYFAMKIGDDGKTQAELTGYLRCGGEVSVLGIVSISIEFTISFTYYAAPQNKAKGRATLEISIEILFFSFSVELTVEKGFGGDSGDPVFKQVMPQEAIWSEYAMAFA